MLKSGCHLGLPDALSALVHGSQPFLEEVLHAGLLDADVRVAALVEDASLAEGDHQETGRALAGGVVPADRLSLLDETAVARLGRQAVGFALEKRGEEVLGKSNNVPEANGTRTRDLWVSRIERYPLDYLGLEVLSDIYRSHHHIIPLAVSR